MMVEGLPQYRRLAQNIRQEILDKVYTDRLPPERELAQKHEVSYMTARKAIGMLCDQGLLVRIHGQGTFVRQPGKTRSLNAVGILLPAGISDGAANPYYSEVIDGACKKCSAKKLGMAISDSLQTLFDPHHPHKQRMVDGMIICPKGCTRKDLELVSRFLPVVLIEWNDNHSPSITVDNVKAMRSIVTHLIDLGHTTISYIGGPNKSGIQSAPSKERKEGFITSMQEASLPVTPNLIQQGDFELLSGYQAAKKLLTAKKRPSAIVCANDLMALGVMRYAIENNIKIPEQLSITGFDDISAASYVTPSLTTIAAPKRKLGQLAVQHLLQATTSNQKPHTCKVLEAELIIRGSTAPANVSQQTDS